jgi:hypothetical protein
MIRKRPGFASKGDRAQSSHPPLPHWICPGKLAIGPLPYAQDGLLLKEAGIDAIVSLCAPSEGKLPDNIAQSFYCWRYILPDSSFVVGLQAKDLAAIVNYIHEQIQQGRAVYVHCLAGVERSPTVCIAYLCVHEKLELWDAVSQVKQAHPPALPTEEQLRVIRQLLS